MNLLQELSGLREGAMKDLIMDLIERAIQLTDTDGMSYEKAIEAIAKKVHEMDHSEVANDHEMLIDMIKGMFDEEDLKEDANWPKLIAHADEFRVEQDEDGQVHILDGEQSIRVSMPLTVWKKLAK